MINTDLTASTTRTDRQTDPYKNITVTDTTWFNHNPYREKEDGLGLDRKLETRRGVDP
jgi:hypothetical protein